MEMTNVEIVTMTATIVSAPWPTLRIRWMKDTAAALAMASMSHPILAILAV